MIVLAYMLVLALTVLLWFRRLRGQTVERLIRNPPRGIDLSTIVRTLSYIEHELIKHRIPVLRGLVTKRVWNDEDRSLLKRMVGADDETLVAEFDGYLEGIHRGAGRTFVNFSRDRAFWTARKQIVRIQRRAQQWVREQPKPGPSQSQRKQVDDASAWLAGPFRRYLVELNRSVFRCQITTERLETSARQGLRQAGSKAELKVVDPPADCVAQILSADLDIATRNLVRNAAQANVPSNVEALILIDADTVLEDTGDESVFIRVHDTNPARLTSEQIYGRDAKRGLGLVTAALGRHRGSLRCIDSDLEGFAKALQIRLSHSLHEPDDEALHIGGVGLFSRLVLPVSVFFNAALLIVLILPYLLGHPVDLDDVLIDPTCRWVARMGDDHAVVECDWSVEQGFFRSPSVRLDPDDLASARIEIGNEDCGIRQWQTGATPGEIWFTQSPFCLVSGNHLPMSVRFSSMWNRRDVTLVIEHVPSVEALAMAVDQSITLGDLGWIHQLLLSINSTSLSGDSETFTLIEAVAATVIGAAIDDRISPDPDPARSQARLCTLLELLGTASNALETETAANEQVEGNSRENLLRYWQALAHLWIVGDVNAAADVLTEIVASSPQSATTQTARFLLALLGSEGAGGVSSGLVSDLHNALIEEYRNPSAPFADSTSPIFVELVDHLSPRSYPLRTTVPEALCGFQQRYPDIEMNIQLGCADRAQNPRLDRILRTMGSLVRQRNRPLVCSNIR